MQNELFVERIFVCCGDPDCKLHRTSCKRKLEHGFKHNADMERHWLDSFDDRNLQHGIKHDRVPLRLQYELHVERIFVRRGDAAGELLVKTCEHSLER